MAGRGWGQGQGQGQSFCWLEIWPYSGDWSDAQRVPATAWVGSTGGYLQTNRLSLRRNSDRLKLENSGESAIVLEESMEEYTSIERRKTGRRCQPTNDRGGPAVGYKWTGWVWEITGWRFKAAGGLPIGLEEFVEYTPTSINKEIRTKDVNQLDLEVIIYQPAVPKNLPWHCFGLHHPFMQVY